MRAGVRAWVRACVLNMFLRFYISMMLNIIAILRNCVQW